MILFYSDSCQHCSVLLDTIKRHDTKKTIKLVCIDTRISTLKDKISKVPALMFLPAKEIIYGKDVFDYLLYPSRGYLFTNNSREKTETSTQSSSLNAPSIPLNTSKESDEPISFSLGTIMSEKFSDINDDNINSLNVSKDRIYGWDLITNDDQNKPPEMKSSINGENTRDYKSDKKLPSLEELTKERENLFKDIK